MEKLFKSPQEQSFETQILNKEIIPNILISIYILLNTTALISENNKTISIIIMWSLLIYGIILFFAGPAINKLVCYKISNAINFWKSSDVNPDENTKLVQRILYLSRTKNIQVTLLFMLPTVIVSLLMYYKIGLSIIDTLVYFFATTLASNFAGTVAFYNTDSLTIPIINEITKQGVNESEIFKKKSLGFSLKLLFNIFMLTPIILSSILMFLAFFKCRIDNIQSGYFIITTAVSNTLILFLTTLIFFKKIEKYSKQMRQALSIIDTKNVSTIKEPFPVDFSNHISYSQYLINTTINLLQNLLGKYKESNANIQEICNDLYSVSSRTQSTIIEQSTSVEEINATISNTNNLSEVIENKINEVINIAKKTQESVQENSVALDINLKVMSEITEENKKMIKGIEFLSSKISSVWETVTLIDSISEQTKIIAFNAELEANELAKKGANLTNVAVEIRNMANRTLILTKEIKDQIRNINECNKTLITTGNNCMGTIQEGYDIASALYNKFKSITLSSQTTSEDSERIKYAIFEQAVSMKEISETLIEIDNGAREFTDTTKKISNTIDSLKKNSMELHEISRKYYGERSDYDI